MNHPIHKITACKKVAPFTLELTFDDNKMQVINFEPVLCGELYGPLRDENLFDQVRIDSEVQTIFWGRTEPTSNHHFFMIGIFMQMN